MQPSKHSFYITLLHETVMSLKYMKLNSLEITFSGYKNNNFLLMYRVVCLMNYTIQLLESLMEFMKVGHSESWIHLIGACLCCFYWEIEYEWVLVYAGIAIGGDVFPGSTLSDHVLRFNNIPQVIHSYRLHSPINITKLSSGLGFVTLKILIVLV